MLIISDCDKFLAPVNTIGLRKTKIVYNFGLSGCNRVKLEP